MPPRKRKNAEQTTGPKRRSKRLDANHGGVRKAYPKPRQKRHVPARTKVFSVQELLENILVHLPMLDILRSQRVSRAFRDAVEGSIAIKRKLFFVADVPEEIWSCSAPNGTDPFKPCFVRNKLRDGVRTIVTPASPSCPIRENVSFTLIPIQLNPLFEVSQFHLRCGAKFAHGKDEIRCRLNYTVRNLKSEASWRRMHLSDPPCRTLEASVQFKTNASPEHSVTGALKLDSREGLTFGDIVDLVIERGVKREHNGKRCRDSEVGTLAEEIRDLESHDGRDACIPSQTYDQIFSARGHFVPTEEQWALGR